MGSKRRGVPREGSMDCYGLLSILGGSQGIQEVEDSIVIITNGPFFFFVLDIGKGCCIGKDKRYATK